MKGGREGWIEMASGLGWSWDWIGIVGGGGGERVGGVHVWVKGKQKLAPVCHYVVCVDSVTSHDLY